MPSRGTAKVPATGESMSNPNNRDSNIAMRAIRQRLDFSKIPTSIQIPNLIEV
jgi:hypothetical protein